MTRGTGMLLGLACTLLLTGCQQMPLRQRVAAIGQRITPAAGENTDKLESQISLARLSERHGQNDYAAQVYESILRKHPQNAYAHHRLAVLLAQKHDYERAEQHFQQALELGQRTPELLADIGYYFYARDQLDEAENMLRESLAGNPDQKVARSNLGLVLGEQGRLEEARQQFSKALSPAETHANMGYVHAMLGDLAQAKIEFNKALTLDSSLRPAADALIQLEQQMRSDTSLAQSQPVPNGPSAPANPADKPSDPIEPNRTSPAQLATAPGNSPAAARPAQDNAPRRPNQLIASIHDKPRPIGKDVTNGQAAAPRAVTPATEIEPASFEQTVPEVPVATERNPVASPSPSSRKTAQPDTAAETATDTASDTAGDTAGDTASDTAAPRPTARKSTHYRIDDSPANDDSTDPQATSPPNAASAPESAASQRSAGAPRRFSFPWQLPTWSSGK